MRPYKRVYILLDPGYISGRGLMAGIARYANLYANWAIHVHGDFRDEQAGCRALRQWNPDGIVAQELAFIRELPDLGIPILFCPNRSLVIDRPHVHMIQSTDERAGCMAAEYFIDKGYRNFAYWAFSGIYWSEDRLKGFRSRLGRSGFDCSIRECDIFIKTSQWGGSLDHAVQWLRELPKPLALLACTDKAGRFLIDACDMAGIHVPEEVAILGVDNDPLHCKLSRTPLSSINLNFEQAGYDSAARLNDLMNQPDHPCVRITVEATHVVTRQSTDVLAIDDPEVAKAVHFINAHAHKPIQVDDVVKQSCLSRSVLYDRFHQAMKRTILDEIHRVRVNRIGELLIGTDLPILQIGYQLGFEEPNHISRYFKKHTGLTPLQYRRKYLLQERIG